MWHGGDEPRYCLITSFGGPARNSRSGCGRTTRGSSVNDLELDEEFQKEGELEAHERRDARTAYYGYDPTAVKSEA